MKEKDNPIYSKNTLEFATVAVEYCAFMEKAASLSRMKFVDSATKLLPILYLKASLLPSFEVGDEDLEWSVTEDMYEAVSARIAALMGEHDSFLDTFHTDMQYSDEPIAAFISENLADVYQDLGNFVSLFRTENEEVQMLSIASCSQNFKEYWGQRLLNALKALHNVRYNQELIDEEEA